MTTGDVSTEQLRRLVDRLSDGLILFDREGTCLYLNPEAVRLIGKSPGELIGKPIREALPVAMSKVCAGARERLIAGDEVLLVPSYFAQGRWFEILGRPLGGDFVVHFRDITERLQAESARRHSEEKFQLLVNGVKDYCLVMLDPKGVVASWNSGAERMTGYTAGEALGKPFASFYVPPDIAETGRRLEEAVRNGSFTGERWFVRKDGSPFLARSTYTCVVDKAGMPSGFALVAQDITEQRKLEASLRRKEERLRLATEAGAVGTWEEILDEDRLIVDAQYLKLTGLAPNQRLRFGDLLSKVHADDRDQVQSERRRVLETEGESEFEFEFRHLRPTDASTRWLECRGRVFESRNVTPTRRVVGVLHDTTTRHRTDEFRNLAAGIIAHDLRSPLSAIKLASELLIDREGLPANVLQRIHTIVQKVDSMVKMVERLLLYTHAQFGGGLSLDKEFIDFEEVCRDVIVDAQASHPDAEIHYSTEGNCCGFWDRIGLTEVASNLLNNAVKHGEAGQPIHVIVRGEGDRVSLRVHNLGPPIPSGLLPVVFEPFRRTKHGSGKGSFGLGLYIVKELVSAHGGTVEVTSSGTAGTTFIVHFPREAASHPAPRVT